MRRAIDLARKHRIAVVLGTPTAAPPAWLTRHYPQTLRIKEDGRPDQRGNRVQFNFVDPPYRKVCRVIAQQMAERFGDHPNVVGWQIDNEIGTLSYGPGTRKLFQDWLKARYGTLANLNSRWSAQYWSQTYTDWSQIPIGVAPGNPGLLLSWKHFISDEWRSYADNQRQVIRAHAAARQFITANMMGWFDSYDHYVVAQDLDLASWDAYVETVHLDPAFTGAMHDLIRGLKQKNFWVMETPPGFVNWKQVNTILDPGETRAMAWNDVGHGADAVLYWQWRNALNGQEQYHGAIVGVDGMPLPIYDEISQTAHEFMLVGPAFRGTTVQAEVAILNSFDSRWAIDFQRHSAAFDPVSEMVQFYRPLRSYAQSVDVVAVRAPLFGYKLVVAPSLNVLSVEDAEHLLTYVKSGGTWC